MPWFQIDYTEVVERRLIVEAPSEDDARDAVLDGDDGASFETGSGGVEIEAVKELVPR